MRGVFIIIVVLIGIIVVVVVAKRMVKTNEIFSIVTSGDANALSAAVTADNVNAVDKWGWTPLMHAATVGDDEACRILLAAGADVARKDTKGYSALDYVNTRLRLASDHDRTAEYLQQQGITLPSGGADDKNIDVEALSKVKQRLERGGKP